MNVDELLQLPPYSTPQAAKEQILTAELNELTHYHEEHSADYRRLLSILFPGNQPARRLSDLPYLPVGLFKERLLASVPSADIFKVLESSGTTGQTPSRVALDRHTARLQTLALSRIMGHVLGPNRLPMILIESNDVVRDRRTFNARAAGVIGMMNFGRDHFYALDPGLQLRLEDLKSYLAKHRGEKVLIFGFTFLVWSKFYLAASQAGLDLQDCVLIHSGGWKHLQDQAISQDEFRFRFRRDTGLARIYSFYGMVEQVGSVFLEGEDGYLYPPCFADVIIRDPITLEEVPSGRTGVIEVLSVLPRSYPGHSLLTEDLGVVHAIDSDTCGRMGKAFSILGRLPKAELRGCSDVIARRAS